MQIRDSVFCVHFFPYNMQMRENLLMLSQQRQTKNYHSQEIDPIVDFLCTLVDMHTSFTNNFFLRFFFFFALSLQLNTRNGYSSVLSDHFHT